MDFPIYSILLSLLSFINGNDTAPNSGNGRTVVAVNIVARFRSLAVPVVPDIQTLCPELANSTDMMLIPRIRYYPDTKKCYTILSQGPCGNNMAFYEKDDIYGECGCKVDNRILIYHTRTKQCYFIFQRGYCNIRQWLDVTRERVPTCTNNPCQSLLAMVRNSNKDLVQFGGKCVEVGKSAIGCANGEVIGFNKNKRSPSCVPSLRRKAMSVPSTPCNLGSVMAIDGRCNPPFDFD